MNWKVVNLFLVLVLLLVAVPAAVAATYTWVGDGDGSTWASAANWDVSGVCGGGSLCYPRTINDDVTIDDTCDACTIAISQQTIQDVTVIAEDVTFDADGETEITIVRFALGKETGAVTVRFSGGAAFRN